MTPAEATELATELSQSEYAPWRAMTRDDFFGRPPGKDPRWGVTRGNRWFDHDPREQ